MSRATETLGEFIGLLILVSLAGLVPSAVAMIGYANENNMVRFAEVIAIVDISHVDCLQREYIIKDGQIYPRPLRYSEIAYATVQQTIKGALPQTVKLYGGSPGDAQNNFSPGRYLVFLHYDQDFLTSCNDFV